jgi:hypothetical protein
MVQVHTCVSLWCDQCGMPLGSPEFEGHYPTEDAALEAATTAGWVSDRGRWWCSCCAPILTCEAQGHEFTPWQPGARPKRAYRYCRRGCLHESRTTHQRDESALGAAGDEVGEVA